MNNPNRSVFSAKNLLFIVAILVLTLMWIGDFLERKNTSRGKRQAVESPAAKALSYLNTPVFEENMGQAGSGVRFLGRTGDRTISFHRNRVVLARNSAPPDKATDTRVSSGELALLFADNSHDGEPHGIDPLERKTHCFVGKVSNWIKDVKNYAGIRYSRVYPGIDVVLCDNKSGLEFDYVVQPGAGSGDAFHVNINDAPDHVGNLAAAAGTACQFVIGWGAKRGGDPKIIG